MFGFLRPDRRVRPYRQAYARCCSYQKSIYGLESLVFLSYESVFLYLWAWDAKLLPGPAEDAPTCCRLRKLRGAAGGREADVARFCASLGMLLGSIKLEDDIRDDRSWAARLAAWRLNRRFARSRDYFADGEPDFQDRVAGYIAAHLRRESADSAGSIAEYATPTAEAFAYLFALFADRFDQGHAARRETLSGIGDDIGRAIIAFDCAVDWQRDRARGSFNPLRNRAEVDRALLYSQSCLARAAWRCRDAFGPDARTALVARGAFQRLTRQAAVLDRASRPAAAAAYLPRRRRWSLRRRGDCDCDPSCCGCLCEGGCPCDGGADGGGCGDHQAIVCCCPCDALADCSGRDNRSCYPKQDKAGKTLSAKDDSTLIGMEGTTATPLKPTGVVQIGKKRLPGKSNGGQWIDGDAPVVVVGQDEVGLIVREQSPPK